VERNLDLTKEIIQEEQSKYSLCQQYKQYEDFWLDEDNVLYRQGPEVQPCVGILVSLVPAVLASYHDLAFTAHQGVGRTVEFIKKKY
jgi:hypothetical protein